MSKKAYGTYDIAKICQVMPSTVGRWIEEGKLPSFSTGGGHRRVWASDLIHFLRTHNIPVPREIGSAHPTILVVEDDVNVRKSIVRLLSSSSSELNVFEAEDGFEAGRLVAELVPQLVILDLRLPGVDGFRVCRQIRSDGKLNAIRILATTGFSPGEAEQQILEAGADAFIAKPFEPATLLAKVQELLSSLARGVAPVKRGRGRPRTIIS